MSILFSVIYSRYITKPIIELSIPSKKLAHLDFEAHGNTNRSDEAGILSDNLNTLSVRTTAQPRCLKKIMTAATPQLTTTGGPMTSTKNGWNWNLTVYLVSFIFSGQ